MVGKRPNHAESALIAMVKACGYKEGKYTKTYVHWKRRSLKRAALPQPPKPISPNVFYANCVWGPFKGGGPYEMDLVFPFGEVGVDFEIDGVNWHKEPEQLEADLKRDKVLKANGWAVVRVADTFLYSKLVPLLNGDLRGEGKK